MIEETCEAVNCAAIDCCCPASLYRVAWLDRESFTIPHPKTRDFYNLEDAKWFQRYLQIIKGVSSCITEIIEKPV